ncbi:hypothetical protein LCGC14_2532880 [marine sediment metagenome]|uniref:Uncharacterized protein n=1 Tax=marine sediment metagenome TaxID=412755 RepID=A0A0F9DLC2_9ZZZZ
MKNQKIRGKLKILEALGDESYKVKIYPELIVLSLVKNEEDLDLPIESDKLSCCQDVILNLLEVIIYKTTGKHLFGVEEINPLVNYNPNKMNKSRYFKTIKKALEFLEIDYEEITK